MRYAKSLFLTALLAAGSVASERDASACGGCFHETEMTQVVGHRMIISVSQTSSTLWDQIEYSGDPQSFAWVLPIKGQVDVGVSADALFQVLEQRTQVTIENPPVFCGPGGNGGGFGSGGGAGTGGTGGSSGVTIIDQEVVGPYETVQLSSADPQALTDWLTSHSYNVPPDIQPIINAYVAEKFDFLALKLVPGKGITSMKPVRVTTPGASPVLPLRMVAAGTGVSTAINLWIAGEGRYEPQNFPSFLIEPEDVVWSWQDHASNYSQLVQSEFDQSMGFAWLTDASVNLFGPGLKDDIQFGGGLDQYKDENGMMAQENLDADMAALYGSLAPADARLTHLFSKLSRPALEDDLQLQASADQGFIATFIIAGKSVGVDPCGNTGGAGGSGGSGGSGGGATGGGGNSSGGAAGNSAGGSGGTPGGGGDCNCSVPGGGGDAGALALMGAGLAVAVAMSRRRRRA